MTSPGEGCYRLDRETGECAGESGQRIPQTFQEEPMACQHQGSIPIFTPVNFPNCSWILACPECGPWDTGTTVAPFALAAEWTVGERATEDG